MTMIRFFTDPHLGRELKANTTPASRSLLQEQLYLHALQASTMDPNGEDANVTIPTVCAGDLFDTDTNPEHILLQGAKVAQNCELVLGGNHDVINVVGRTSTLSALAALTDTPFVLPPGPGQLRTFVQRIGDVDVFMIPHHTLQDHFEKAMDEAQADAKLSSANRKLIVLHCNYHLTMGVSETDLNLTDARARLLMKDFDFVILGHDHRPRWECDDRLLILGNTHPTSFSDLGEKYVWFYDSSANQFSKVVNCGDSSRKISAEDLIQRHRDEQLSTLSSVEWLDVTGILPPEAAVDLAKAIRATWKACPYMYAIRASKVLFHAEGLGEGVTIEAAQKTLLELVEEDLSKTPDLLELFQEAKVAKES